MRPSFIGQGVNGVLAMIAIIMFILHYKEMDNKTIIEMLLFISITIGVHSILHHFEEIYYDYNPLVGKWQFRDNKL